MQAQDTQKLEKLSDKVKREQRENGIGDIMPQQLGLHNEFGVKHQQGIDEKEAKKAASVTYRPVIAPDEKTGKNTVLLSHCRRFITVVNEQTNAEQPLSMEAATQYCERVEKGEIKGVSDDAMEGVRANADILKRVVKLNTRTSAPNPNPRKH